MHCRDHVIVQFNIKSYTIDHPQKFAGLHNQFPLLTMLKTMIHRAYALSSTTDEVFNQECTSRLRSIFTRLDYPLAMINSIITKTIQSFSFGTRENNEKDSNVVRVSLPFKDQTSANAVKRQMRNLSHKIGTTLQPIFISRKLEQDLKPR